MGFTDSQAKRRAQQIFDRFGFWIHEACVNTGVQESFVAGFTGVEAGVNPKTGLIKPEATRFEQGVYNDLVSLRDHGYCFIGGKKHTTYCGVTRAQIANASDADLRALATSYSFSQIMGWHCINNLKCTIADLRDPNKHFGYTVKLLKIVGGQYMKNGDLTAVLHIWNTGSANGKTYHEDYVVNALKVKHFYEEILRQAKGVYPNSTAHQSRPVISANTPSAPLLTDASSDNFVVTEKKEIETDDGTISREVTKPAGDAPDDPAKSTLNVQDWKQFCLSVIKRIWAFFTGVNVTQMPAVGLAAIKSGDSWWIWIAIGAAVFILTLLAALVITVIFLAIWHFNRKEISSALSMAAQSRVDPNRANLEVAIEKFGISGLFRKATLTA